MDVIYETLSQHLKLTVIRLQIDKLDSGVETIMCLSSSSFTLFSDDAL